MAKKPKRNSRPVAAAAPGDRPPRLASASGAGWPWATSPWMPLLAAGLIVLAVVAAYANSFAGVFVFDDRPAILENPTIQTLWPLGSVLSPPGGGITVSGRPLLNLSFALSYALGGLGTWGYHLGNLLIHLAAALLLLGIVRRTLLSAALKDRWAAASMPLALAVSLLWALHPVQTESVTYIVQRAESLVALFYLLTLFCVIRGATVRHSSFVIRHYSPLAWYTAAVVACLAGMASKEIMVTAPLVVLLYDRTFLAGSFREALRRRWGLYLALAATWVLLAWLVQNTGEIQRNADLGIPGPWPYARSQPGVILHYLRLVFWPHPLCLNYAWPVAVTLGEILPGLLIVGALGLATLWALVWRPAWGFLGAWFFLILGPTSSIMPLGDLAFEHRIYLALAAVLGATSTGLWLCLEALVGRGQLSASAARAIAAALLAAATVAFGALTFARNQDYHDEIQIWEDTIVKAPWNARAHNNLGALLTRQGKCAEGAKHLRQAVELAPEYVDTHANLGMALMRLGRREEAIAEARKAVDLNPRSPLALNNFGSVLHNQGQLDEAIVMYRRAIQLMPNHAIAHNNLGNALYCQRRFEEAMACYLKAVAADPTFAEACNNLGDASRELGRPADAIMYYRKALQLDPNHAEARSNLGQMLRQQGK